MSKPCSMGRCTQGLAKVLSQTVMMPRLRASGGQRREVDQLQQRVGRRLHPEHAGLRPDRRLEGGGVGQIDKAEGELGRALAHPGEEPPAAAVEILHGDHMIAAVEELQRRRRRRHARGEGIAGGPALQIGDAALIGVAGRVLAAGILIALVLARALLDIGRGGVDRRHDGAGRGIGRLAGMDGAGGEAAAVALFHDSPCGPQAMLRRRWFSRSMRVMSPRNSPPSTTSATWFFSKIGSRSASGRRPR